MRLIVADKLQLDDLLTPGVDNESALITEPHIVVFIDGTTDRVLMVNMTKEKKPSLFSLKAIYDELDNFTLRKAILDTPAYLLVSDESLTARQRELRDTKFRVIEPIIRNIEEYSLSNNYGKNTVKNCLLIAKSLKVNVNRTQVYQWVNRFLKAGSNKNAFLRKPGSGHGKNKTYLKKTGPKRDDGSIGRMINDSDKRHIENTIRKKIFTKAPLSYAEAYEIYLDNYASDPVIDTHTGEILRFKRWDIELRLSRKQFENYAHEFRNKNKAKEQEAQGTSDQHHKDVAGLKGNLEEFYAEGPGHVYQIDETPLAVELVDEFDPTRQKRVGRPTCYSVVDLFSSVWVAILLTFAKASAHTAREIIFIAFRDKTKFCEEIGIKLNHPFNISGKCRCIMVDNHEFKAELERSLSQDAHIEQIYNTEGRSSQKGAVERKHKSLEDFLFGLVPGVGRKNIADYLKRNLRKDALLNIRELYQLLIDFITTYNNFAPVESLTLTKEMKQDGVQKVPMSKFEWGLKHRPGYLKPVNETELYLTLLEVGQVTVHREYILLPGRYFKSISKSSKGLKYNCQWILENGVQDVKRGTELPKYPCRFMRYSLGIIYIDTPDGLKPAYLQPVDRLYQNMPAELVANYKKEEKIENNKLSTSYQENLSAVRINAENIVANALLEKQHISANAANSQDLSANRDEAIKREIEASSNQFNQMTGAGIDQAQNSDSEIESTALSVEQASSEAAHPFAQKMKERLKNNRRGKS